MDDTDMVMDDMAATDDTAVTVMVERTGIMDPAMLWMKMNKMMTIRRESLCISVLL